MQLVNVLLDERVQRISSFVLNDDFFEYLLCRRCGNTCENLTFVFLFLFWFRRKFCRHRLSRCIGLLNLLDLGCFNLRFWFCFLVRNNNFLSRRHFLYCLLCRLRLFSLSFLFLLRKCCTLKPFTCSFLLFRLFLVFTRRDWDLYSHLNTLSAEYNC